MGSAVLERGSTEWPPILDSFYHRILRKFYWRKSSISGVPGCLAQIRHGTEILGHTCPITNLSCPTDTSVLASPLLLRCVPPVSPVHSLPNSSRCRAAIGITSGCILLRILSRVIAYGLSHRDLHQHRSRPYPSLPKPQKRAFSICFNCFRNPQQLAFSPNPHPYDHFIGPLIAGKMMPGAGLYLPNTLTKSLDQTEKRAAKTKSSGRKSSQDSNMDRESITFSRSSSEDVTRVFSSLSTVFDFADWASVQGKVSSDSDVFVSNLQRVRRDVTEASRLYSSHTVADYLESWPDKKIWIDDIIRDIERALNDIGRFIEAVRVSGDDGGTAGLKRKFQWALSHQKKLVSKQQHLMICHQSLMSAVQLMQTAEMNATFDPIHELPVPTQPWTEDDLGGVLRSPRSRQKWRSNQKNSSVPSITVSEPDMKDDKFGS